MKKLSIVASLLLVSNIAFSQNTDNSLVDEIEKIQGEQLETLQDQFSFQAFESCQAMDTVLQEWVDTLDRQYPYYRGGIIEPFMIDGAMDDMALESEQSFDDESVPTSSTKSALTTNIEGGADSATAPVEFSTTNTQKKGVDEPEIIKTNGEILYYYNQQEKKIAVMKTPLESNRTDFDFSQTQVLADIAIPASMNEVQMFLYGDMLVVAGTRWLQFDTPHSLISKNTRTVVAVYNMQNPSTPQLVKFHDIDGSLNAMRMIDNKLYLLTYLPLNWQHFYDYTGDKPVSLQTSQQTLPKVYSLGQGEQVTSYTTDCNNISYILPSEETTKQSGLTPQFTMVTAINIENHDVATTVAFGHAGQIHMATDALYMVQNHWIPTNYYIDCPFGLVCTLPRMGGGQYSLVHKFSLDDMTVLYKNSSIVPGSMLTQYSMDQDAQGFFRILTSIRSPEQATNFYVFDKGLDLVGKLENIEPGETFQSSRYIDDKLYLVTFRQIDPLFVIDIEDPTTPTIIGELKIPGFSTYLHPMGAREDNKQYLIGLGNFATNEGMIDGLQLSLYEVAYDEKETVQSKCSAIKDNENEYNKCRDSVNPDNIRVSEIDSLVQGGQGSWSEALYNPRMFVINADNEVTLPMLLKEQRNAGQNCQVFYDQEGKLEDKECYDIKKDITTFAGLKSFAFDKQQGITETASVDYQEQFKKTIQFVDNKYSQGLNSWDIQNLMMRVGFIGETMYSINNDFAHFFDDANSSYLYFDGALRGEKPSFDINDKDQNRDEDKDMIQRDEIE